MVVAGESIHDAFGRREKTQRADSGLQLGKLADDGISHLDGARRDSIQKGESGWVQWRP